MTIKNTNKNVSAENHEDVVINASFNNGILTLIRKNLYDESTSAQKNIEVDLSDHKLKLKVLLSEDELDALKISTDPDDIRDRESYIFLVPFGADEEGVYREYIWIEDDEDFEIIGSTRVDLSNYVQKSNTNGLIKNDGTIDTNTYVDISDFGNLAYEDDVDLSTHDVSELTDTQNTAFTPKSHNHNVFYGTCSTSASIQTKVVSVDGWSFNTGNILFVKFDDNNNYDGTARLSIDGTVKDIVTVGTTKTNRYYWKEGEVVGFVYDGTNMTMLEQGNATMTYYGVTKLSDSTSSTSTGLSATANAVRKAYELADSKADEIHTHGNLQNNGQVGTSNNASKNVVTDSNGYITTEAKPIIDTTITSSSSNAVTSSAIHSALQNKADDIHNHSSSNITDMAAVTVTITYTDNTTETLTLFKQVNNS